MKISRRKLLLGVGAAGVIAGGAAVVPMIRREGRFESTPSRVPAVAGTEGKLPASA
ncbi:FAD-dependent oxidoreductase, partial [Enterobacter cloacae complex sp.6700776]